MNEEKKQTLYWDRTGSAGSIGIIAVDTEIIPAGTTLYIMEIREKNEEYQRFVAEYDIHFIFEDKVPSVPFYTVPHVDIMAVDSQGGFIGTVSQVSDLESESPICYIDKNLECYLIAESEAEFLKNVASWKKNLKPYDKITFYPSKAAAEKELEFFSFSDWDREDE